MTLSETLGANGLLGTSNYHASNHFSFFFQLLRCYQIAGRDTTAQTLSWMFYLLNRDGTDPSIKQTLVQEVDDVLEGELPSYESYKRHKFAEAWYETTRPDALLW